MEDTVNYYSHIKPPFNLPGKYLLLVETDKWASCEVIGDDTYYEIERTVTYHWSESKNGEEYGTASHQINQVNGVPLRSFCIMPVSDKSAVLVR